MKRRQIVIICLALWVMAFLLAACGGDDEQPAAESGATTAYPGATAVPISETQPQLPEGQNTGEVVAATATVAAPTATAVSSSPTPPPAPTAGPLPTAGVTTPHTVQEREWLHQIARCYGASASEIVTANSLPHPGWIMAGEVWNIPNVGSLSTPIGPPCLIYYTVQSGDTLLSISSRYSVPVEVLMFANYGCYGYNAHYDYVPGGPNYDGYGNLGGCYYTSYPPIYAGNLLVIPVTLQNAGMR